MLSRRLHNDEGSECAVLIFWAVFGLKSLDGMGCAFAFGDDGAVDGGA